VKPLGSTTTGTMMASFPWTRPSDAKVPFTTRRRAMAWSRDWVLPEPSRSCPSRSTVRYCRSHAVERTHWWRVVATPVRQSRRARCTWSCVPEPPVTLRSSKK
jgi:hypothetical protein